jgi:chromosome segregation ATPase
MSEKLPEGWTDDDGHGWRHSGGAGASVHRIENRWRAVVVGVERGRQTEAGTDRLNMIAGLEGRLTPDLEAAQKEIDTLYARLEASAERHDAVVEKLDALGVPFCGGLVERIEALASERDAALAKVANLETDVTTLTEAREYLERNIGELEDRRDADEAHVADLELALSVARLGHDAAEKRLEESERSMRRALTKVMGLRMERDNLRHTIATQQTRIDGLTAATCDVAPQLLRDSMRVTQEENARLRAEAAMLAAKVDSYAAHIEQNGLSHARTVQERNTCMGRMESLRADLAKVTGERDALLKERPSHRLAGVFAMQDRLVEAAENAERLIAEIATLTARATAAEGYAQHLLAALNAVSGFRGMP